MTLSHVWWFLFYVFSGDIHSMDDMLHSTGYWAAVILDYVTLLPTIASTLLAMLQDRHRPVWPVFVVIIPFMIMGGVLIVWPNELLMQTAFAYILLLYVLFTIYIAFAVRQYGRWLNDNYADLENKKVWLSQAVSLACLLLFILYALVDTSTTVLIYLLHVIQLALFGLLLWRVETLPKLEEIRPTPPPSSSSEELEDDQEGGWSFTIDLAQIERLLKEHCVDKQLYMQHDLTLQQLAQAVGTNRSYLSQYFSRQGITYNTYINNLRINHFINLYQELAATRQPIVAQELAQESGFRSYRTFSRAFLQRMGQSATDWMRQASH